MDDRLKRVHVANTRVNSSAKKSKDPEDGYLVVLSDGTEIARSTWIAMSAEERAEYLTAI